MISARHSKPAFRNKPRHQESMHRVCSTGPGGEPKPVVRCEAPLEEDLARSSPCLPPPKSAPWGKLANRAMDELPAGKQRLMEKFFSPVSSDPTAGWGTGRGVSVGEPPEKDKHLHQKHTHSPQRQHHHHQRQLEKQWTQDRQTQGCITMLGNSPCHHYHHGYCSSEHHHGHSHQPHCDHHHHSTVANPHAFIHSHSHTPGPISSTSPSSDSSSSSSSSSSFSSSSSTFSSEASLDNQPFLVNREQTWYCPRNSQSCTDISRGRRDFQDEEEEEDDTKPLLEDDNRLYKSVSLERNLVSRSNTDGQTGTEKPRRAESSNLLHTRGILKNRQEPGGRVERAGNFRKTKSLEALSHQGQRAQAGAWVGAGARAGSWAGAGVGTWRRGTGKPEMDPREMEKKREEARQNFVKEKIQFSAFLNEITRQVLSPARLSSLGVMDTGRPCNPGQSSAKCPQEEQRMRGPKLGKGQPGVLQGYASSVSAQRSTPQRHGPRGRARERQSGTSTSLENSPCLGQGQSRWCGERCQADVWTRPPNRTNTRPELSLHVRRHHPPQRNPSQQPHLSAHSHHGNSHLDVPPAARELEIVSSGSNSSQNTTSSSSEDKHTCHNKTAQRLKDKTSEVNRIRFSQDQNKDLYHRLLQTSMCMECMGAEFMGNKQQLEAELQRTRMELIHLRDKFKRFQDNYSSTQQTNYLLEQKLHSVAEKMDGEREHLKQCISELNEQLSTAKTTIRTLQNINVPSLLQEAVEKPFQLEEAANQILLQLVPPPAKFMDSGYIDKASVNGQVHSLRPTAKEEEADWSKAREQVWTKVVELESTWPNSLPALDEGWVDGAGA